MVDLGSRLLNGDQVDHDPAAGLARLETAAERGSSRAAYRIGNAYYEGKVVLPDLPMAFTAYVRAAELDNQFAAARAGWMLERGKGVAVDVDRAMKYYRQAAAHNEAWSQNRLAALLFKQSKTPAEEKAAWDFVAEGSLVGSTALQKFYLRAILAGWENNSITDQKVWEKMVAATDAKRDGEAEFLIGQSYWLGCIAPFDLSLAYTWMKRASDHDYAAARLPVIACLAYGVGTAQDLPAALQLRTTVDPAGVPAESVARVDRLLVAAQQAMPAPDDTSHLGSIWRERPLYPENLRHQDIQGEAIIQFQTDENGFARNVRLVRTTHPEFGYAATVSVSFWRMVRRPLEADGLSRALQVPIVFSIRDEPNEP